MSRSTLEHNEIVEYVAVPSSWFFQFTKELAAHVPVLQTDVDSRTGGLGTSCRCPSVSRVAATMNDK